MRGEGGERGARKTKLEVGGGLGGSELARSWFGVTRGGEVARAREARGGSGLKGVAQGDAESLKRHL
jgi:hypothetical protein